MTDVVDELVERPEAPGRLLVGGAWVVAGGLVAAVTGPTGWEDGSWVAAFSVLVAGVAQIALAAGPTFLPRRGPQPRASGWDRLQVARWNGGCLAVVAGTLASSPVAVTVGGAVLAVALARTALATRGAAGRSTVRAAYQLLIVAVLVSIPIGLALSWVRH